MVIEVLQVDAVVVVDRKDEREKDGRYFVEQRYNFTTGRKARSLVD